METKPTLYVLAGPHGSGKSRSSRWLVPAGTPYIAFGEMDLDLKREHPELTPDARWGVIADYSKAEWRKALTGKTSFAVETHFRSVRERDAIVRGFIEPFQEAGHRTVLHLFGLDHLVESIKRVERRVLEGGYGVLKEAIPQSFFTGPGLLKKDLLLFDQVNFIHAQAARVELFAILLKESRERLEMGDRPAWYHRDYRQKVEDLYPYRTLAHYIDPSMSQNQGQGFTKGLWL